jgi:class 3 adenylate cyclase
MRLIDQWLPLPRVVLFSGHMLDQPGRQQPRFPASLEPAVYAAIRDWLASNNGLIGISSAACGADLLFLEAVHELGGETHILLPYDRDEFVEDSIESAGSGQWRERFERQLKTSRVVYASSSRPLDPGLAYDYANRLIHGLGVIRARELGSELVALAVWNGQSGDGRGGAASAVRQWQQHGLAVNRVRIEAPRDAIDVERLPPSSVAPTCDDAVGSASSAILSLLFADVVGFSRLTDAELTAFVEGFLPLVVRLIEESGATVPVRETWGDALFLAFTDAGAAGLFALNLRDAMAAVDWPGLGFSRPLTMRFALHAGPVQLTTDPITGLPKCCGAHVSRAARLEPTTPPGQVYASEAFAALAALDDVIGFRCDYVKRLDWAKRYGSFPAYVVRRR